MVKPKFSFFQMQRKCMLCYPMELCQAMFSVAPKRLNSVDML